MNLKNSGVRIVVSDPKELAGKNIFGRIDSYRDETLIVSTSTPFKIRDIESTVLRLIPLTEGESLRPLMQSSAVFIRGTLIKDDKETRGIEFTGTIVVD